MTGEVDAATLDISGNADIDGTLEADAITVGGVTLATTIATTVGAMVAGNTESGIAVTFEASDNTLDFDVNDPSITLTGDVTGTGTMTNLGNVSIATTRTAGSTDTSDIADDAITQAKIADNSVGNGQMLDNSINTAELVNDSVSRAKLKDEVVLTITNSAGSVVKTLYGAGS